jgi:hypothetical protein
MQFIPMRYDPEKRIVHYDNGGMTEKLFIEKACVDFLHYGRPAWLLWAVEQGLPGLMEIEGARMTLHMAISGRVNRRGHRPQRNLADDLRREQTLKRVWFHMGRGLPVYVNPDSGAAGNETACHIAGTEVELSASRVYAIWKEAGGHDMKGAYAIGEFIYKAKGRVSIK